MRRLRITACYTYIIYGDDEYVKILPRVKNLQQQLAGPAPHHNRLQALQQQHNRSLALQTPQPLKGITTPSQPLEAVCSRHNIARTD